MADLHVTSSPFVGKRVRGWVQGEIPGDRDGTIIDENGGVCVIKWDDPKSVVGVVLSSRIHILIDRFTAS